jgi:hypothetical protein
MDELEMEQRYYLIFPHDFFSKVCGFNIPEIKQYAVGMVLCQSDITK